MKRKSNLIFIILGSFIAGNICLLCSYIFIYFIGGAEIYANEIIALTDIRVLLSQLLISGLGSIIFVLFFKMILNLLINQKIENPSLKTIIKLSGVGLLKTFLFCITLVLAFEILFNKSKFSENLTIGYSLFLTLTFPIISIAYITIQSTKNFNKKLQERKQEQLEKNKNLYK